MKQLFCVDCLKDGALCRPCQEKLREVNALLVRLQTWADYIKDKPIYIEGPEANLYKATVELLALED